VIRYGREQSGGVTFWFGSGGTGDRNGKGVDRDGTDDERGKNDFGEHDDWECGEKKQTTTAPGLRFGREELVGAAQRLGEPGGAPRPFYQFGGPIDIRLSLVGGEYILYRGQTCSICIRDLGIFLIHHAPRLEWWK